jgi:hypothetical protein
MRGCESWYEQLAIALALFGPAGFACDRVQCVLHDDAVISMSFQRLRVMCFQDGRLCVEIQGRVGKASMGWRHVLGGPCRSVTPARRVHFEIQHHVLVIANASYNSQPFSRSE